MSKPTERTISPMTMPEVPVQENGAGADQEIKLNLRSERSKDVLEALLRDISLKKGAEASQVAETMRAETQPAKMINKFIGVARKANVPGQIAERWLSLGQTAAKAMYTTFEKLEQVDGVVGDLGASLKENLAYDPTATLLELTEHFYVNPTRYNSKETISKALLEKIAQIVNTSEGRLITGKASAVLNTLVGMNTAYAGSTDLLLNQIRNYNQTQQASPELQSIVDAIATRVESARQLANIEQVKKDTIQGQIVTRSLDQLLKNKGETFGTKQGLDVYNLIATFGIGTVGMINGLAVSAAGEKLTHNYEFQQLLAEEMTTVKDSEQMRDLVLSGKLKPQKLEDGEASDYDLIVNRIAYERAYEKWSQIAELNLQNNEQFTANDENRKATLNGRALRLASRLLNGIVGRDQIELLKGDKVQETGLLQTVVATESHLASLDGATRKASVELLVADVRSNLDAISTDQSDIAAAANKLKDIKTRVGGKELKQLAVATAVMAGSIAVSYLAFRPAIALAGETASLATGDRFSLGGQHAVGGEFNVDLGQSYASGLYYQDGLTAEQAVANAAIGLSMRMTAGVAPILMGAQLLEHSGIAHSIEQIPNNLGQFASRLELDKALIRGQIFFNDRMAMDNGVYSRDLGNGHKEIIVNVVNPNDGAVQDITANLREKIAVGDVLVIQHNGEVLSRNGVAGDGHGRVVASQLVDSVVRPEVAAVKQIKIASAGEGSASAATAPATLERPKTKGDAADVVVAAVPVTPVLDTKPAAVVQPVPLARQVVETKAASAVQPVAPVAPLSPVATRHTADSVVAVKPPTAAAEQMQPVARFAPGSREAITGKDSLGNVVDQARVDQLAAQAKARSARFAPQPPAPQSEAQVTKPTVAPVQPVKPAAVETKPTSAVAPLERPVARPTPPETTFSNPDSSVISVPLVGANGFRNIAVQQGFATATGGADVRASRDFTVEVRRPDGSFVPVSFHRGEIVSTSVIALQAGLGAVGQRDIANQRAEIRFVNPDAASQSPTTRPDVRDSATTVVPPTDPQQKPVAKPVIAEPATPEPSGKPKPAPVETNSAPFSTPEPAPVAEPLDINKPVNVSKPETAVVTLKVNGREIHPSVVVAPGETVVQAVTRLQAQPNGLPAGTLTSAQLRRVEQAQTATQIDAQPQITARRIDVTSSSALAESMFNRPQGLRQVIDIMGGEEEFTNRLSRVIADNGVLPQQLTNLARNPNAELTPAQANLRVGGATLGEWQQTFRNSPQLAESFNRATTTTNVTSYNAHAERKVDIDLPAVIVGFLKGKVTIAGSVEEKSNTAMTSATTFDLRHQNLVDPASFSLKMDQELPANTPTTATTLNGIPVTFTLKDNGLSAATINISNNGRAFAEVTINDPALLRRLTSGELTGTQAIAEIERNQQTRVSFADSSNIPQTLVRNNLTRILQGDVTLNPRYAETAGNGAIRFSDARAGEPITIQVNGKEINVLSTLSKTIGGQMDGRHNDVLTARLPDLQQTTNSVMAVDAVGSFVQALQSPALSDAQKAQLIKEVVNYRYNPDILRSTNPEQSRYLGSVSQGLTALNIPNLDRQLRAGFISRDTLGQMAESLGKIDGLELIKNNNFAANRRLLEQYKGYEDSMSLQPTIPANATEEQATLIRLNFIQDNLAKEGRTITIREANSAPISEDLAAVMGQKAGFVDATDHNGLLRQSGDFRFVSGTANPELVAQQQQLIAQEVQRNVKTHGTLYGIPINGDGAAAARLIFNIGNAFLPYFAAFGTTTKEGASGPVDLPAAIQSREMQTGLFAASMANNPEYGAFITQMQRDGGVRGGNGYTAYEAAVAFAQNINNPAHVTTIQENGQTVYQYTVGGETIKTTERISPEMFAQMVQQISIDASRRQGSRDIATRSGFSPFDVSNLVIEAQNRNINNLTTPDSLVSRLSPRLTAEALTQVRSDVQTAYNSLTSAKPSLQEFQSLVRTQRTINSAQQLFSEAGIPGGSQIVIAGAFARNGVTIGGDAADFGKGILISRADLARLKAGELVKIHFIGCEGNDGALKLSNVEIPVSSTTGFAIDNTRTQTEVTVNSGAGDFKYKKAYAGVTFTIPHPDAPERPKPKENQEQPKAPDQTTESNLQKPSVDSQPPAQPPTPNGQPASPNGVTEGTVQPAAPDVTPPGPGLPGTTTPPPGTVITTPPGTPVAPGVTPPGTVVPGPVAPPATPIGPVAPPVAPVPAVPPPTVPLPAVISSGTTTGIGAGAVPAVPGVTAPVTAIPGSISTGVTTGIDAAASGITAPAASAIESTVVPGVIPASPF